MTADPARAALRAVTTQLQKWCDHHNLMGDDDAEAITQANAILSAEAEPVAEEAEKLAGRLDHFAIFEEMPGNLCETIQLASNELRLLSRSLTDAKAEIATSKLSPEQIKAALDAGRLQAELDTVKAEIARKDAALTSIVGAVYSENEPMEYVLDELQEIARAALASKGECDK